MFGVPQSYFLTFEQKITLCRKLWEIPVSTWHALVLLPLPFVLPPPKKKKKNEPRQKSGEKRDRTEQKMKTVLIRTSLCSRPYFAKFSLPGAKEPPVALQGKIFLVGKRAAPKIFREKRKRKSMSIECTKQEVLTHLHKKVRNNTVPARQKSPIFRRY